MPNEFEVIRYDNLKHFRIFVNQIVYRNFHMHNVFEFFLVLDGNGTLNLNDTAIPLETGSLIVLNPNEPHEINALSGNVMALVFQFSPRIFEEYFPQLHRLRFQKHLILPEELRNFCIRQLCTAAEAYLQQQDYFALDCIGRTAALLRELLPAFPHELLADQQQTALSQKEQRMERIMEQLEGHYAEKIMLKDLAAREHITMNHLSHLFTTYFGISFQDYLNNLRFEKAMVLMEDPALSQLELALAVGFSDPKYLSRMMKKRMGCTVGEYRQRCGTEKRKSSMISRNSALEQILDLQQGSAAIRDFLDHWHCVEPDANP